MKYVQVYDVETSGAISKGGGIISLGCVIANQKTLEVVDRITLYSKPPRLDDYWCKYAYNTHKLSRTEVQKFPAQSETVRKLMHFIHPYLKENEGPLPFIMHSVSFVDFNFIENMFMEEGLEESFEKLARKDLNVRTDLLFKEYRKTLGDTHRTLSNLSYACEEFDFKLNHHEVESDTLGCHHILRELTKYFGEAGVLPNGRSCIDWGCFNKIASEFTNESL